MAITTQSSPADRVLRVHKAEQSWEKPVGFLKSIGRATVEGQVIQQDDRMCSTEEDEKKEGKIYTHTLLTSGRLNI